jgi:hypothetical protein
MKQNEHMKPAQTTKLWQLLLLIAVVLVGTALLPQRVGLRILFFIVGAWLVALLCLLLFKLGILAWRLVAKVHRGSREDGHGQ